MRISVKRTGGFAGVTEELASVDTASLNRASALQLEQMVREARFFDLPAEIPGTTIGADLFRYEVTVTEGDRQHTVAFADDGAEIAPLRRLMGALGQV